MALKAVIFDWGGVVVDNPFQPLMAYLGTALQQDSAAVAAVFKKHEVPFQKGLIGETVLWQELGYAPLPASVGTGSLWLAAVRACFVARPEVLAYARALQAAGYKTALLSNTEKPTVDYFLNYAGYSDCFDRTIFSACEHIVKPDAAIYRLALERLGCQPEESIYIDDNPVFVDTASNCGMLAVLYISWPQVVEYLVGLGIEMVL